MRCDLGFRCIARHAAAPCAHADRQALQLWPILGTDHNSSRGEILLCHLQRLEQRELDMAEELKYIKEQYVSLEANMAQVMERLQMQDAEESRKLKRSNSFYGVFGLSK